MRFFRTAMIAINNNFTVVFVLLTLISLTQACTKSCNGNGFCYIENGIEKCQCLDRIYVGESCQELVNYCDANPCKNGKCVSSPGQYNCICSSEFYGQNCTSKKKLFGQVYLQYNHLAPLSGDNNFLIILTDLGAVVSMVEMATPVYAIIGGLTFSSNNSRDFVRTDDIEAISRQFNIPNTSLPTGTVFYHEGRYRMETDGIDLVTLAIIDASENDSSLYYKWDFQFGSIKNVGCNPLVKVANCGTPNAFVPINVKQSVYVEANIRRDCGHDSQISYKWSISDLFDTKTVQTFHVNSRSLKIPPFGIQIDYESFGLHYLVKLVSLERSADGKRHGESINRCYISISEDKPIAKISGGERQEYSRTQGIIMDGSDSVDLLLHPKRSQNLLYVWNCSSNDNNDYCKELNETAVVDSH